RHQPDLEQPRLLRLAVVLRMHNAAPRMHHLDVARDRAPLVAEVVAMGDGAGADIGDDLHVPVRMRVEASAGRNLVVVPDPERAEAHPVGVMVISEAEVMARVQPLVLKAPKARERPHVDHCTLLTVRYRTFRAPSGKCRRPGQGPPPSARACAGGGPTPQVRPG